MRPGRARWSASRIHDPSGAPLRGVGRGDEAAEPLVIGFVNYNAHPPGSSAATRRLADGKFREVDGAPPGHALFSLSAEPSPALPSNAALVHARGASLLPAGDRLAGQSLPRRPAFDNWTQMKGVKRGASHHLDVQRDLATAP